MGKPLKIPSSLRPNIFSFIIGIPHGWGICVYTFNHHQDQYKWIRKWVKRAHFHAVYFHFSV